MITTVLFAPTQQARRLARAGQGLRTLRHVVRGLSVAAYDGGALGPHQPAATPFSPRYHLSPREWLPMPYFVRPQDTFITPRAAVRAFVAVDGGRSATRARRFHAILEHAGYRLGFVVLRTAGGRYRWEVLSVPDTATCATFAEEMAQARYRGEALCAWSDAFPSSADDSCVQWCPAPAHRSTCHLGSHTGR